MKESKRHLLDWLYTCEMKDFKTTYPNLCALADTMNRKRFKPYLMRRALCELRDDGYLDAYYLGTLIKLDKFPVMYEVETLMEIYCDTVAGADSFTFKTTEQGMLHVTRARRARPDLRKRRGPIPEGVRVKIMQGQKRAWKDKAMRDAIEASLQKRYNENMARINARARLQEIEQKAIDEENACTESHT